MQVIKHESSYKRHLSKDVIAAGVIFIAAGVFMLFRNLGYVDSYIANILISWPMLLVVLGVWTIAHKSYQWGILTTSIGAFFLIPLITGAGAGWMQTYWPFVFVIVGVQFLVYLVLPKRWKHRYSGHCTGKATNSVYSSADGFVKSENNFGSLEQIVMDEFFTGAKIENNFGSTVIDLRRTSLKPGDTVIDLETNFGEVKLYVPETWVVVNKLSLVCAGMEDKRINGSGIWNDSSRLVVQGSATFGGVEIR